MKTRITRWITLAPLAAVACLGLAACTHNDHHYDDDRDRDYSTKTSKETKTESDLGTVKRSETTEKTIERD